MQGTVGLQKTFREVNDRHKPHLHVCVELRDPAFCYFLFVSHIHFACRHTGAKKTHQLNKGLEINSLMKQNKKKLIKSFPKARIISRFECAPLGSRTLNVTGNCFIVYLFVLNLLDLTCFLEARRVNRSSAEIPGRVLISSSFVRTSSVVKSNLALD